MQRGEKIEKRGEVFLENYAKVVLYAYPYLKTVREDYEEHIRNRALLSYRSRLSTESLMEYLAEEILCKEKLEWLKETLEGIFERLSEEERMLIEIRYFGRRRNIKKLKELYSKGGNLKGCWSERSYFRKQRKVSEKVDAMLRYAGLTKERYEEEYAKIDILEKVQRFVEAGKDKKICLNERQWLGK